MFGSLIRCLPILYLHSTTTEHSMPSRIESQNFICHFACWYVWILSIDDYSFVFFTISKNSYWNLLLDVRLVFSLVINDFKQSNALGARYWTIWICVKNKDCHATSPAFSWIHSSCILRHTTQIHARRMKGTLKSNHIPISFIFCHSFRLW